VKEVIIIGNKPHGSPHLDNIIDSFKENYRCGLGLPGRNNGTKYDKLGMCCHVYANLVTSRLERSKFLNTYKSNFDEEFLGNYYDIFPELQSKYKKIYHAVYRTVIYNKQLAEWGCPYRFSKTPRTGSTVIFENLLKQNKVFIAFFSLIYDDVWISCNGKLVANHGQGQCHCKSDETKILMWLHENQYIDATLCMLEDNEIPTLNCRDIEPSEYILNMLKEEHGKVVTIK